MKKVWLKRMKQPTTNVLKRTTINIKSNITSKKYLFILFCKIAVLHRLTMPSSCTSYNFIENWLVYSFKMEEEKKNEKYNNFKSRLPQPHALMNWKIIIFIDALEDSIFCWKIDGQFFSKVNYNQVKSHLIRVYITLYSITNHRYCSGKRINNQHWKRITQVLSVVVVIN